MRSGLVADDMGSGKTVQTFGYILRRSTLRTSLPGSCRPVLILAPSVICYQWVNEIREQWPGLTVYLFHGRNEGPIGKKYKGCRILADDIRQYAGDLKKDPIKNTFRHLFDNKHEPNRTTVVIASYDTFKIRTAEVGIDPEEEKTSSATNSLEVSFTLDCAVKTNCPSVRYGHLR